MGATNRNVPVRVRGLPASGVTAIAAGRNHALAVVAGNVYAWGNNALGQLGTGSTAPESGPVRVPGLSGVTALGAGRDHTLAISTTGLYAWGPTSSARSATAVPRTSSRRTRSMGRRR